MPFGAMFGVLVFGGLAPWMAARLLATPWPLLRLLGAFLMVFGLVQATSLLARQRWARWTGVIGSLWLLWFSVSLVMGRGAVLDILGLIAAVAALVLFVIPRTGKFPREDAAAPAPAGPAPLPSELGAAEALLVAAPAPARVPGRRNAGWTGRILAFAVIAAGIGVLGVSAATLIVRPPARARAQEASTGAPAESAASADAGGLQWLDFATGLEKAKGQNKLMVVDFYAVWCGPCKMMERRTFRDPKVVEKLTDFVPVRVDSEEEMPRSGLVGAKLAERYEVEVYPTLVVVDGTGREVARRTGFQSPAEFLRWLDSLRERAPRI